MRGRIEVGLSEHYKQMKLPALRANYRNLFNEMMYCNKAHTVMLGDCGILDAETVKQILGAIDRVHDEVKETDLSLDNGDDLYLNVEHQMISRIGSIAGKMHTGRSRNDLYSTLARMVTRRELTRVMRAVIDMQEVLIGLAKDNVDTVMTGYTHMQPAQPTTLAHYLTSYLQALCRDYSRLEHVYKLSNQNPLGAAAFAGTGFPIDREETTKYLGFDSVVENTWDGVASRDFYLEADAAYAILQNTLSRVAQDIFIWCTDEFAVWELGGQVSGQSSIMPQKKNPSTLEEVKTGCSGALASLNASMMALKNSSFSFICDSFRMDGDFISATDSTLNVLETMKETLKYSSVHKERALSMAEKNFCTVTGLADTLVRRFNIAFRDAHHITGGMVSDAKKAGLDVNGMDAASLRKWSEKILGAPLDMTDDEVHDALAVLSNVDSKKCIGGPNRVRVHEMIAHMEAIVEKETAFIDAAEKKVEDAYNELDARVESIVR